MFARGASLKAKISILIALASLMLSMLACENADPVGGTADYTGTTQSGYSCPAGQYLSGDDSGHQVCRIESK
jgi:hypothetical protein